MCASEKWYKKIYDEFKEILNEQTEENLDDVKNEEESIF